ncbi:hypothetical protein ABT120_59600 [Nonomuraea angiospora]
MPASAGTDHATRHSTGTSESRGASADEQAARTTTSRIAPARRPSMVSTP